METMSKTATKLMNVMKEAGYVQKDATNDFHKYRYASAEAIFGKVREALARNGLTLHGSEVELVKVSEDMTNVISKVTLHIADADTGEMISISGMGQGTDKGDKAVAKSLTQSVKYALSSGFLISWGDDPEADSSVDWTAFEQDVNARIAASSSMAEIEAIGKDLAGRFKQSTPPSDMKDRLQKFYKHRKEVLTNGNGHKPAGSTAS